MKQTESYLTGDMKYYNAAKKNLQLLKNAQSSIGFVGSTINLTATSSQHLWLATDTHIDAGIDSYYEYLLKCWKLFADNDCLQWWNDALYSITTYLSYYQSQNLWFIIANMNTGKIVRNVCFNNNITIYIIYVYVYIIHIYVYVYI
ncbi:hypothetical protein RFI_35392 [Reticulomyxa filosa]|uniref:Alpha-1,2-Mannosidase n=1 Tax=Reticulomyxa filosa TaxID=46433 RepID=X6LKA8_RETFI|nr:hypothetical protein RFI_35392 [Reticulomyxa filosa]|eukprot:ETO02044.1 hypothetical protein RFI_35392 [Reticulomyxa filosa]